MNYPLSSYSPPQLMTYAEYKAVPVYSVFGYISPVRQTEVEFEVSGLTENDKTINLAGSKPNMGNPRRIKFKGTEISVGTFLKQMRTGRLGAFNGGTVTFDKDIDPDDKFARIKCMAAARIAYQWENDRGDREYTPIPHANTTLDEELVLRFPGKSYMCYGYNMDAFTWFTIWFGRNMKGVKAKVKLFFDEPSPAAVRPEITFEPLPVMTTEINGFEHRL